jgi:hypothetical protein
MSDCTEQFYRAQEDKRYEHSSYDGGKSAKSSGMMNSP